MQPVIPTPTPDSCDRRIIRAIFTINLRAQFARSDAARISTADRRIFNLLDAPDHYVERVVGLLIDRGALILRDGWLELPQGSPMVWL
jgi:hypothetical protein